MISPQEFISRQTRLLSLCPPDSLCVIPSATLVTRSRDTEYKFRQDSDFWYLTGFNEPNALLILSNHTAFDEPLRIMFCQPSDPTAEIWQGKRLGLERTQQQFSLDSALSIDEFSDQIIDLLRGHQHLFYCWGERPDIETSLNNAISSLRQHPKENLAPSTLNDWRPFVHEMRLFKSGAEIAAMKAACSLSAKAHQRAMTAVKPGMYEYQLAAEIQHEFAMQGAEPAYGTIVGSGENACILHYTQNDAQIADGDLILIDAGAELFGYAGDITRTFPANGKFTDAQIDIYNVVLDAQLAVLDSLRAGITLKDAMQTSIEVITRGLCALGILQGSVKDNLHSKAWQQFYMHGIGHFLGLDVHDVGNYKQNDVDRPLQPGMVITVEPGIYIAKGSQVNNRDVAECYQGIGVRIEDDVVITADGIEILTHGVPKSVADIESLMSTPKHG